MISADLRAMIDGLLVFHISKGTELRQLLEIGIKVEDDSDAVFDTLQAELGGEGGRHRKKRSPKKAPPTPLRGTFGSMRQISMKVLGGQQKGDVNDDSDSPGPRLLSMGAQLRQMSMRQMSMNLMGKASADKGGSSKEEEEEEEGNAGRTPLGLMRKSMSSIGRQVSFFGKPQAQPAPDSGSAFDSEAGARAGASGGASAGASGGAAVPGAGAAKGAFGSLRQLSFARGN